jgi:preprotein translocase SecE subunit
VKDKEDKEKMSTATIAGTSSAPDASRGKAAERSAWSVHKPGEGYATRLGMMVVIMAYVGFACHHWYYNWVFVRDFFSNIFEGMRLAVATNWTFDTTAARWIAASGTTLLAVAGLLTGYYFVYLKRQSAEFLIKTDTELGKVTWPKITPWFKPDTQVWGATYVVLLVIAGMTVYIFGVDFVLQGISQYLFYKP